MTGQSDRPEWLESLQEAAKGPDRHFDPGESRQSDRIPRTEDYTRPADPRFAELVRDTSNDPHLVAEAEKLLAAAPPEPPNLDCGRLARAIDEHIESDCPRDMACDGTCADSIAERYGGAAPDRLPSVEALVDDLYRQVEYLSDLAEQQRVDLFGDSLRGRVSGIKYAIGRIKEWAPQRLPSDPGEPESGG